MWMVKAENSTHLEDITDDIDKLVLHQISHTQCECFMFQSKLD